MELQELQNIWAEYDRKLDRSLQVNMQLLRQLKLDKVESKTRGLFILKLVETVWVAAIIGYLVSFITQYLNQWPLVLSGLVVLAFAAMGFVSDIRQLSIIMQLKLGYDDAIAPIQKKIESLKTVIIDYIKYGLLFIPCYPFLMIVAGKTFMHVDFTENARRAYFLSNVAVGAVLAVPIIWIFVELSRKDIKPWAKNLLSGSGWFQANAAADFLKEIENFEKEG